MIKLTTRQLAKQKLKPKRKGFLNLNCIYNGNEYAMKFPKINPIKVKDVLDTFCHEQINSKFKKSKPTYQDFEVLYNKHVLSYEDLPEKVMKTNKYGLKFDIISEEITQKSFVNIVKKLKIFDLKEKNALNQETINAIQNWNGECDIVKSNLIHFLMKSWNNHSPKYNNDIETQEIKVKPNTNFIPLFQNYKNLTEDKSHLRLAVNHTLESITDNNKELIIDNNYTIKPFARKEKTPDIVIKDINDNFVMPITIFPQAMLKKRLNLEGKKNLFQHEVQNKYLQKGFETYKWKNFDLLRSLSKTRNEFANKVQFGLVTNLYKWMFTMYYRPDNFEFENENSFVSSRFFDVDADLTSTDNNNNLENIKKQIKHLMFPILQLKKLDRSHNKIIEQEVELIHLLDQMKFIKLDNRDSEFKKDYV